MSSDVSSAEMYGHGAEPLRGRSASSDVSVARYALKHAADRLLRLGGVDAQACTTRVDGRVVHYLDAGAGPAIVLLHGASGGGANWFRLIAPLTAHFRVLAPDLPGFGCSDAIEPEAPLGCTIADVMLQWLSLIGVRPSAVVGTSFGGLVALRMQQRGLAAERLVLLDSAGLGRSLPAIIRVAALPGIGVMALRPSRRGIEWQLEHLMTANLTGLPAPQLDALVEYLWRSAAAGDLSRMARGMQLFADLRGQREVLTAAELRGIESPALLLWGELDRFFASEHGRAAAAVMPRAQFHLVPGAGHSPNWEAPDLLLERMLPFLLATGARAL